MISFNLTEGECSSIAVLCTEIQKEKDRLNYFCDMNYDEGYKKTYFECIIEALRYELHQLQHGIAVEEYRRKGEL